VPRRLAVHADGDRDPVAAPGEGEQEDQEPVAAGDLGGIARLQHRSKGARLAVSGIARDSGGAATLARAARRREAWLACTPRHRWSRPGASAEGRGTRGTVEPAAVVAPRLPLC